MDFDKCFYNDLFEPFGDLVFPNGTCRMRGRKDVDVQSIRTLSFNVLHDEEARTGTKILTRLTGNALADVTLATPRTGPTSTTRTERAAITR